VLPEDRDGVLDLILIRTPTQPSHTFFRSLGFADVCGPQDHIPIVSELCHMPPETQVKHCRLRGHVDAYRCCAKLLMWSALVRCGVRQHARTESISNNRTTATRIS
jgi:hypothetical protein